MSPILRLCARGGCMRPRTKSSHHCLVHANEDNARRQAKGQAAGRHTGAWRRLRAAVLLRDGHRCTLRLPGCTGRATSVHLDPALKGNHHKARLKDCRSACATCHGAVDAPRAAQGQRRPT